MEEAADMGKKGVEEAAEAEGIGAGAAGTGWECFWRSVPAGRGEGMNDLKDREFWL